jgi:hypothetical protein
MSKVLAAHFAALAEGLEAAAAAARALEGAYDNATAKSQSASDDAVAGKPAGSKGKGAAAAPAVAGKPAAKGKAKAPVITFDDVKAKLTELMNTKGKDAVKEILSEFGAAKLADLDTDSYADAHAKAVAAMAEEEEATEAGGDDDLFGD